MKIVEISSCTALQCSGTRNFLDFQIMKDLLVIESYQMTYNVHVFISKHLEFK